MNAGIEFLRLFFPKYEKGDNIDFFELSKRIEWFVIEIYDPYDEDYESLRVQYNKSINTAELLEDIIIELDFNYDSGYGTQYLYGTIMLTDGTWFERFEYDGSERWRYVKSPTWEEECFK